VNQFKHFKAIFNEIKIIFKNGDYKKKDSNYEKNFSGIFFKKGHGNFIHSSPIKINEFFNGLMWNSISKLFNI
jgi:hypothetical protein